LTTIGAGDTIVAAPRERDGGSGWPLRFGIALLALAGFAAPPAHAQLGVTAEVERPMARTGGDDPTASATEVDARARPHALDALEDAMVEVPGARPLRSGAHGSPTTLSLRGSDADQVEVLFGDVPVTTADGGAFDLSTVPLWALERVEVHRGGAPTWLGVGGMGGVVRLVPRQAERGASFRGTLGVGSWGLVHGRLGAAVANDDVRWLSAVGATSSEGDFPYVADRTPLDGIDGVERRRENGALRQGAGLGHLRLRLGDGHLTAFLFGLARLGGVPGPASQPTRRAHRHETHLLGAVGYTLTEGGRRPEDADWRFAATASVGHRRRRFTDRRGEVGLVPRATDDGALRSVLRAAASGRPNEWLELTGVVLWTHEALWPEDALAREPNEDSARDAGTVAVEARLHGRVGDARLELRPSARLAVYGSRLRDLRAGRTGQPTDATTVAPTFRVGAALAPVRGLTVAASVASATRVPTMVELFGDRGYLVGDSTLRPERAETVDLGVALRGRAGPLAGRAELRGFATFATDRIRYRRNTRFQAVPENVPGTTVLSGGELGVRGRLTRHVALAGALTLLETWAPHGPSGATKRLPLRPWLTAYVRPTVRAYELGPLDELAAWADLSHVSATFWDPANTSALEPRTRIGLGLSLFLWRRRLRLDVAVRDVLDRRGTDLLGFPLPGRSLAVSLTVGE
jgi:iron complex outermembrane receptor protein